MTERRTGYIVRIDEDADEDEVTRAVMQVADSLNTGDREFNAIALGTVDGVASVEAVEARLHYLQDGPTLDR